VDDSGGDCPPAFRPTRAKDRVPTRSSGFQKNDLALCGTSGLRRRVAEREGLLGAARLAPSGPPSGCYIQRRRNAPCHQYPTDNSGRNTEPYGRYPSPSSRNPRNASERRITSIAKIWRRERDSNPRRAFDPYTLSRGAPSTTRPSLRVAKKLALSNT
jgi:hypothetical protein